MIEHECNSTRNKMGEGMDCTICGRPGVMPLDYEWPVGSGKWNTHYINHGNTWHSMRRPDPIPRIYIYANEINGPWTATHTGTNTDSTPEYQVTGDIAGHAVSLFKEKVRKLFGL